MRKFVYYVWAARWATITVQSTLTNSSTNYAWGSLAFPPFPEKKPFHKHVALKLGNLFSTFDFMCVFSHNIRTYYKALTAMRLCKAGCQRLTANGKVTIATRGVTRGRAVLLVTKPQRRHQRAQVELSWEL